MKWIYTCFLLTVSYLAPAQVEKILLGHVGDAGFKRIEIRPMLCGMRGVCLGSDINPVYTAPKVTRDMSGPEPRLHQNRYADPVAGPQIPVVRPPLDSAKPSNIRIRCGSGFPRNYGEPLLVIDGIMADSLGQLNKLDPSTIVDITVLQSPAGQAIFGPRAQNGVIIVSIKPAPKRILKVVDAKDGMPLPGATVRMESTDGRSVLQYLTDETGYLVSKDWVDKEGWNVKVTATGYLPYNTAISRARLTGQIIEMKLLRNVITCPGEVIVHSGQLRNRGCGSRGVAIRSENLSDTKEPFPAPSFKVFPNPVRRGERISIVFPAVNMERGRLNLFTADGHLLMSQAVQGMPGQNRIMLPVSSTWSAGMYFVRLQYANGSIAASEQVIIQ